jgi:hypothetical protein
MAQGILAPPAAGGTCHTGLVGGLSGPYVNVGGVEMHSVATFMSAPFANGLSLAGPVTIRVYYTDEALGSIGLDGPPLLRYSRYEVAEGRTTKIASDTTIEPLAYYGAPDSGGPSDGWFDVGAYSVAPGSRLSLLLYPNGVEDSTARLLFGGSSLLPGNVPIPDFGDSGITFAVSDSGPKTLADTVLGGAFPFTLLVTLLAIALARRP